MLRKMMIALFVIASVGILAADVASARGGGGRRWWFSWRWRFLRWRFPRRRWFRRGFRGGGMGMGGAGFRGGGMGMVGAGFRGGDRRPWLPYCRDRRRWFPYGRFAGRRISRRHLCRQRRGGIHPGFRHHRRFPLVAVGVGLGYGLYGDYGYYNDYDYGYDDSYHYGDSGCYIVRRSVLTPYGWRIRPVQVCG